MGPGDDIAHLDGPDPGDGPRQAHEKRLRLIGLRWTLAKIERLGHGHRLWNAHVPIDPAARHEEPQAGREDHHGSHPPMRPRDGARAHISTAHATFQSKFYAKVRMGQTLTICGDRIRPRRQTSISQYTTQRTVYDTTQTPSPETAGARPQARPQARPGNTNYARATTCAILLRAMLRNAKVTSR